MPTPFLDFLLRSLDPDAPGDAVLRAAVDANREKLEAAADAGAFWRIVVAAVPPEQHDAIRRRLERARRDWLAAVGDGATRDGRPRAGGLPAVAPYLGGIAVGLFTFVLLGVIVYIIWNGPLLQSLADIAVARGLITVFFTLGAIGISVVMIAALFLSAGDGLKARFDSAKEVLTALIAILGTVVGFYFGSADSERADQPLELAPVALSDGNPTPGETVQLTTLAGRGEAPYRYSIDFRWGDADEALARELPDIANKETPTGLIVEPVTVPKGAAGKTIPYVILVTDARNRSASLAGETLTVAPGTEEVAANQVAGAR